VSDDGTISIATGEWRSRRRGGESYSWSNCEARWARRIFGTVNRIVDFGAFVEIFRARWTAAHLGNRGSPCEDVRDELKEGQQILVKCIGREGNKIKLSRKAVLREENRKAEAASPSDGGGEM
jgi:polyribonucleotide nucleotidyltransferase